MGRCGGVYVIGFTHLDQYSTEIPRGKQKEYIAG